MGRKSRHMVVLKPFCYYCDKEFNNEIILHQHQKARHFNCLKCRKRFSTAPALEYHTVQVHKITLQRVPNAKTGRDKFDISIYGMDGVPLELMNYKLAEKVQYKRRKLIKENKLIGNEEDLKNIGKKKDKREKEREEREKNKDIANLINTSVNAGFYHNPDSINLTLKQKQMNQMYTNKNNPMLKTLGFGFFNGMQNSLQNMNSMNPLNNISLPIQGIPEIPLPNQQQIPMMIGQNFNNLEVPSVIGNTFINPNQMNPINPESLTVGDILNDPNNQPELIQNETKINENNSEINNDAKKVNESEEGEDDIKVENISENNN